MKKRLIKKEDLIDKICGKEFWVGEEMILSPSAKDFLREKGIKILYGPKQGDIQDTLANRIRRILKDSFGIEDSAVIEAVIKKVEGGHQDGNK